MSNPMPTDPPPDFAISEKHTAKPTPAPDDPYANKAVVAAIGTVVTTGLRWAISGEFSLSDEGVVALAGAITTVAVYAVSNYRRILGLKR